MLSISDIKKNSLISINNEPYKVVYSQLSKRGRAGSVLNTKLKNLVNGSVLDRNFKQGDSLKPADVSEGEAQYLYKDETGYFFMDNTTFEQFSFGQDFLGDDINFLKEGENVKLMSFDGRPIAISVPVKVVLEVVEATPATKGNTVTATTKTVRTETGFEVDVPMFVEKGDMIKINTLTGEYETKVG
jgi:elongation factor P